MNHHESLYHVLLVLNILIMVDVQVSNISFPDFDLDETDLGGTLTWTPPVDESQIEHYVPWLIS